MVRAGYQLNLKKKLGLRWADSPRNFVLKEEDLLTQAEKTPEHHVPPLHRGPLPCEWAGPLPVLWETPCPNCAETFLIHHACI